ncbi:unnamed protein product [Cunninghamella blakesleeana]
MMQNYFHQVQRKKWDFKEAAGIKMANAPNMTCNQLLSKIRKDLEDALNLDHNTETLDNWDKISKTLKAWYNKKYNSNNEKELESDKPTTSVISRNNNGYNYFNHVEKSRISITNARPAETDQINTPTPAPTTSNNNINGNDNRQDQLMGDSEERDGDSEERDDDGDDNNDENDSLVQHGDFNFTLSDISKRYIVNNFDVSQSFFNFQQLVKSKILSNEKLSIESDVHHILSLSSILLLKTDRMHGDIKPFIGKDNTDEIIASIYEEFEVGKNEFDDGLMLKMINIVKNVKKYKMSRLEGSFEIMKHACSNNNPLIRKILLSIRNMLETLPMDSINDNPKEMELITRYLHPALSPLFDDLDANIFFRWTAVTNQESKSNNSITKRRPDASLNKINGSIIGLSCGFGEVKNKEMEKRHYQTQKDLVRLAHFSKNSIDQNNLSTILTFQVIGHHITFYAMKCPKDSIYTMTQIAHLLLPTSIYHLIDYLTHLDEILDVVNLYYKYCTIEKKNDYDGDDDDIKFSRNKKQKTLSTPEFNRFVEKKIDSRRFSITSHYGN